jgi:hypothetical protein
MLKKKASTTKKAKKQKSNIQSNRTIHFDIAKNRRSTMASIIENQSKVTNHASDSEDEDGSDDEECENSLQIGFAEPVGDELMFDDPNWKEWDGGRIGGKPFWLDKKNVPSPKKMECEHCKEPLSFLLQVSSSSSSSSDFFFFVFMCIPFFNIDILPVR